MAFEPVKQTNKLLELQFAEPHLYHRYALTIVNDYLKSENMTTDFNILNKYISKHVSCVEGIVMVLLRFQTAFDLFDFAIVNTMTPVCVYNQFNKDKLA